MGQGSSVTTIDIRSASPLSLLRPTSSIARSSAWAVVRPFPITAFFLDAITAPEGSKITAPIGKSGDDPDEATSNATRIISSVDFGTLALYLYFQKSIK